MSSQFYDAVQVFKTGDRARSLSEWRKKSKHKSHVWDKPIHCWNGCIKSGQSFLRHHKAIGSQNHSQHDAISVGYYEFVVDIADFELKNGMWSREHGSHTYYYAGPLSAKMLALAWAKRLGDERSIKILQNWLFANWVYEAIASVNFPNGGFHNRWRRGTMERLQNQRSKNKEPYKGLISPGAGMRITTAELNNKSTSAFARDMLLSWALDIPNRSRKNNRLPVNKNSFWDIIISHLGSVNNYKSFTPSEIWGITVDQRNLLKRIALDRDPHAIKLALDWYRNNDIAAHYMLYRNGTFAFSQEVELIRYDDGSVEQAVIYSVNGNKAGIQFSQVDASRGTRDLYAAVPHRNVGGNTGWVVDTEVDRVVLSGRVDRRQNNWSIPRFRDKKVTEHYLFNGDGITQFVAPEYEEESKPPKPPVPIDPDGDNESSSKNSNLLIVVGLLLLVSLIKRN